jgi:hypothetical protein
MGKSINPMRASFQTQGEAVFGFALGPIVLMSLQPAIPWRVALQQSSPPFHRLDAMYHPPAETVNHHLARAGEFSTGTMGNFQPELTRAHTRVLHPRPTPAPYTRNDHALTSRDREGAVPEQDIPPLSTAPPPRHKPYFFAGSNVNARPQPPPPSVTV